MMKKRVCDCCGSVSWLTGLYLGVFGALCEKFVPISLQFGVDEPIKYSYIWTFHLFRFLFLV